MDSNELSRCKNNISGTVRQLEEDLRAVMNSRLTTRRTRELDIIHQDQELLFEKVDKTKLTPLKMLTQLSLEFS